MLFADVYLRHGIHIGLLAIVLIVTGCDEDVVPVLQNDRPFSLYGVLSPDHDSQWVRVYPIEERLNHAIAGYRVSPFPWLDASLEGFYKDLENLFIPEWTTIPQLTTRLEPVGGRAAGADLRLEVRKGPFYGFLNYGLSTTTYTPHGRVLRYWFGEDDPNFRPPHDRTHQINLLASASIGGFDVSARWQFGSGLPYSRALGFDGFALIDDLEQAYEIQGTRRVLYERPYNGVLPTYHRLDVSAERSFSIHEWDLRIQASVINVYDRRNLFYLDVFTLRRVDQLPVVPSIGVKLALR